MPIYRTKGVLTGTIEPDNVAKADNYLREFDMTEFLDENCGPIEHIEWKLGPDGHQWNVTAFTRAPLTPDELKQLSEWVSGQNSDGLGESFEQQDFAELDNEDEETDCSQCDGSGVFGDDDELDCTRCGGDGVVYHESFGMISFDWEKNLCTFERIK